VAVGTTKVSSAFSQVGSRSVVSSSLSQCLSCASFMRLTRTRASGRRPVPDLMTSRDSGSYRLRSANLSVMKRRDPRNHLELGRNMDGN
jgi:hypothetical protein